MSRRDVRTLEPRSLRAAAVGALIAAVMTLPGLGTGTLWDNSETAYGEIAREILLTHDAVVMHFNGYAWFIQPPLYFWLGALMGKLLGVTTFALRFPSAVASIAASAATAWLTARAAGERAGVLAAAVLSTALMQAIVGRLAIMDALLDTAVTVAIFAWFYALERAGERDASFAWVAGWAAIGLGTLAKGFVAPVLAIAVIAVWYLWERRIVRLGMKSPQSPTGRDLFGRRPGGPKLPAAFVTVGGLALALAIVAPWTILEYFAAGPTAFGEMVGHYTVGRYLGTIENQSGPFWYYVPVVILGFFPWIAYLAPSVRAAWSERGPRASLGRLALVWTVVPLLFFSFAKTKLPNYVALELPALAILVGLWFDGHAFERGRRTAIGWTAVVPVAFIALLAGMFLFTNSNSLGPAFATMKPDLFVFVGTNLVGSLICFGLFLRADVARYAPYALTTSTIVAWLFVALVGEPHAERFKPVPKLAAIIDRERRPDDSVAIQGVSGGNALIFYTHPRVDAIAPFGVVPPNPNADPHRAICLGARAFVIASKKRPVFDPTFGRARHEIGAEANDILLLYDGPPCDRGSASSGHAARRVAIADSHPRHFGKGTR